MPTRFQVCTWIAAVGLLVPSLAAGQDRTERDIVELVAPRQPTGARNQGRDRRHSPRAAGATRLPESRR